jgi:hypothetical protein
VLPAHRIAPRPADRFIHSTDQGLTGAFGAVVAPSPYVATTSFPMIRRWIMAEKKEKVKEAIDKTAEKAKDATDYVADKSKQAAKAAGEKTKEVGQKIKDSAG